MVRGPPGTIGSNVTLSKETIVSTIDIAPTVLEIILEGITAAADPATAGRLRTAIEAMDGLSFWDFLKARHGNGGGGDNNNKGNNKGNNEGETTMTNRNDDDPFVQRTDLLISYHGEGNPKCGLSECPAPLDGLWWMPDSYNNTYHCVRTLGKKVVAAATTTNNNNTANPPGDASSSPPEDSIYCVFEDDERFVEYYDLNRNPHQLGNDFDRLGYDAIRRYERRLRELLS